MRLFIAINFTDENLDILTHAADILRENSSKGNFTRTKNFHLTLAFLGEVPETKVSGVRRVINEAVKGIAPFDFSIGGLGRFKRTGGDIYWLGVERKRELFALADNLKRGLKDNGYTIDDKPFKPHLTLGREMILDCDPKALTMPELNCHVSRISLMKSERIRGILTYTEIFGKELN
ncbi:MAG: RNA 2',3'-cyclic phosphodiesterase [Ruminococcaceae bacterium]|nr:RNA 2',3'-cyclic phosphodiesterase [Oscillospiraceae bacterium]